MWLAWGWLWLFWCCSLCWLGAFYASVGSFHQLFSWKLKNYRLLTKKFTISQPFTHSQAIGKFTSTKAVVGRNFHVLAPKVFVNLILWSVRTIQKFTKLYWNSYVVQKQRMWVQWVDKFQYVVAILFKLPQWKWHVQSKYKWGLLCWIICASAQNAFKLCNMSRPFVISVRVVIIDVDMKLRCYHCVRVNFLYSCMQIF